MSNSTALLVEHAPNALASLDPTAFDVNSIHAADVDTTVLAQSIEAEYVPAGITFDDLADSNAQSIARKIGFLILLAQLFTVVFKGLGGHGSNIAMAYGAGGGVLTRLVCTIIAVFMLTDLRVIPPIIDMLQEGVVYLGNWIFQNVEEDASSGYSYTY